jgi:hypothetical protein
MSKFTNDVRASSADPLYQGTVFSGSLKSAMKQAKAAPDYGLPQMGKPFYDIPRQARPSRSRFALLSFLNFAKPTAVGHDL